MKDLTLVVVSVVLTALLGRTWGYRRLLHQVEEQLTVLKSLPDEWNQQRRSLEELTARDLTRYIRLRNPSFPIHRLMSRGMDTALFGILIGLLANMSFVPGSDAVKEWVAVAGLALAAVAVSTNLILLLKRRHEVDRELERSTPEDQSP